LVLRGDARLKRLHGSERMDEQLVQVDPAPVGGSEGGGYLLGDETGPKLRIGFDIREVAEVPEVKLSDRGPHVRETVARQGGADVLLEARGRERHPARRGCRTVHVKLIQGHGDANADIARPGDDRFLGQGGRVAGRGPVRISCPPRLPLPAPFVSIVG
jgi:hypothetical protein